MKIKESFYLNTILDSIADGVFAVDRDYKITLFNSAAEKITGVAREDAIGQYCHDVLRANICQGSCALKKTIETKKNLINQYINILNSKGKRLAVSISTGIIQDDDGTILGGVETFRDLSVFEELKKEITKKYTFEDIISKNHKIQAIFTILPNIAESDSTVLIQGASGTGKELFARAIHNLSHRKNNPFIPVSCGALPDTLLESELFGYKKGAFTDAKKDKPGRFALAQKGTLFLDEIGDISQNLQVKLLRVLQEKEYEPLGSVSPEKSDVRIIAATNKDLNKLVYEGKFRDDLFYRINVIKLELPALNERQEDIPVLIDHFIGKFNKKFGKSIVRISNEALSVLLNYNFPGNIRELENIIERAIVLSNQSYIGSEHLPREIIEQSLLSDRVKISGRLVENEEKLIKEILNKNHWNRKSTAEELGINPSTLWRKMKKYNIVE